MINDRLLALERQDLDRRSPADGVDRQSASQMLIAIRTPAAARREAERNSSGVWLSLRLWIRAGEAAGIRVGSGRLDETSPRGTNAQPTLRLGETWRHLVHAADNCRRGGPTALSALGDALGAEHPERGVSARADGDLRAGIRERAQTAMEKGQLRNAAEAAGRARRFARMSTA